MCCGVARMFLCGELARWPRARTWPGLISEADFIGLCRLANGPPRRAAGGPRPGGGSLLGDIHVAMDVSKIPWMLVPESWNEARDGGRVNVAGCVWGRKGAGCRLREGGRGCRDGAHLYFLNLPSTSVHAASRWAKCSGRCSPSLYTLFHHHNLLHYSPPRPRHPADSVTEALSGNGLLGHGASGTTMVREQRDGVSWGWGGMEEQEGGRGRCVAAR